MADVAQAPDCCRKIAAGPDNHTRAADQRSPNRLQRWSRRASTGTRPALSLPRAERAPARALAVLPVLTTSTRLAAPARDRSHHARLSSVPGGSSRPAHTSAPARSLAAILRAPPGWQVLAFRAMQDATPPRHDVREASQARQRGIGHRTSVR
jgi:hypothetical protein